MSRHHSPIQINCKRLAKLFTVVLLRRLSHYLLLVLIVFIWNSKLYSSVLCSEYFKALKPNPFNVEEFYNSVAQSYHHKFKNQNADTSYLEGFLEKKNENRILDAGCGDGRFIPMLSKYRDHITGVDISSKMLELAKSLYPQVEFQKMDLLSLKFDDSTFDEVVALYSIIHLSKNKIQTALTEFQRVLKPSGRLLLALQEGNGPEVQVISPVNGQKLNLTLVSYTQIETELASLGFKIILVQRRDHLPGLELPYTKLYVIAEKE